MCDTHGNPSTLSYEKRIEAAMILMCLDNPIIAVAEDAVETLPKSGAVIYGRGKMIHLGAEAVHFLLKATFHIGLHNEVKHDFRGVHVVKIAKEIPLHPALAQIVYDMEDSERHYLPPNTFAIRSLACPSPYGFDARLINAYSSLSESSLLNSR